MLMQKVNKGRSLAPAERFEQVAVFHWARLMAGRRPELELLHAIPNGGQRDPAVGAKMKVEGVKRGVPDIMLPVARSDYHGLYIEMKRRDGGTVREEQKWWINKLREQGYRCEVCCGAEVAIEVIEQYLDGNFCEPTDIAGFGL